MDKRKLKVLAISVGSGIGVTLLIFILIPMIIVSTLTISEGSCGSTDDTSVTVSSDGTIEQNKKAIWSYLIQKGLSSEATAGVMGNMQAESGFDPSAIEGNGEGHGLIQWSFGRKTNLLNSAKEKGVDWTDLNFQLDFLWDEVFSQSSVYRPKLESAGFFTSSSVSKTTYYFHKYVEASADTEEAVSKNRVAKAEKIYEELNGTNVETSDGDDELACETDEGNEGGILTAEGVTIDFNSKYYTYNADGSLGNPNVCETNKSISAYPQGSICVTASSTGRFNKMICSSFACGRYWDVNYHDSSYPLPTNWDHLITNCHTAPGNGKWTTNENTPIAQSIVTITSTSGVSHAAFIEGVDADGSVVISECNVISNNEYGFRCQKWSSLRAWMTNTLSGSVSVNGIYGK